MRSLEAIKDPRSPMQLQTIMRDAGLVNVESRMIPVPLSAWSSSKFSPVECFTAQCMIVIEHRPPLREPLCKR